VVRSFEMRLGSQEAQQSMRSEWLGRAISVSSEPHATVAVSTTELREYQELLRKHFGRGRMSLPSWR
jgi:hypothetical protein